MKPKFLRWLTLFFLALPFSVMAQKSPQACDPGVYKTLSLDLHIGPLSTESNTAPGYIVASACKSWPNKPHLLIAVVAFDEQKEDINQLAIALIDTRAGRVVNNLVKSITSDGFYAPGGVFIDTARYQLAKDVRAFGVVINNSQPPPSSPNSIADGELTLYVTSGTSLDELFSLPRFQYQSIEGAVSVMYSGAIWKSAEYITLSLGTRKSNGLIDLVARAQVSETVNEAEGLKTRKERVESHTLRFDGMRYQPSKNHPWWLN